MNKTNRNSFWIAIIISTAILYSYFNLPKYKYNDYKDLTYDVASYYLYLPMTIIYHDPGMKTPTIDSLFSKYKFSSTLYQVHITEGGTRVPNYTSGMSYFYFPFFLIGHAWALHSGYPADGFSYPYHRAISVGMYLFIIPGIFFLRKLLLAWFSDNTVSLALVFLLLGTNYFSESVGNHLQPHAGLFSLYVFLLYQTKRWHDRPNLTSAAIIGFCAGWITLTRPTDIICWLIPLLWNVCDKKSAIIKLKIFKNNIPHLFTVIVFAIIPFIPQFIYWKITTGNFIYYSYKNTEGFDFLSPHIWNVLFSFKKSLFIYTPLLVLPVTGLFLVKKKLPGLNFLVFLFTIINFYLLSSWAVWWNGASMGMRYFVQSYSLLSIPLCLSLERVLNFKIWKYPIFIIACLFVFLNLFQTWQWVNWIIPGDQMNYKYYKSIFLKTKVTDEQKKLMETYRDPAYTESFKNENEYTHYTLAYYDFENINSSPVDSSFVSKKYFISAPNSCRLSTNNIYYPTYKIRYDNLVKGKQDHVWLRVMFDYYSDTDMRDNPASLVINFPHYKYNLKYRAYDLEKDSSEKRKWNSFKVDYMTPYPYSETDNFEIYVWYRGKNELFIDNFKIEAFEKINP